MINNNNCFIIGYLQGITTVEIQASDTILIWITPAFLVWLRIPKQPGPHLRWMFIAVSPLEVVRFKIYSTAETPEGHDFGTWLHDSWISLYRRAITMKCKDEVHLHPRDESTSFFALQDSTFLHCFRFCQGCRSIIAYIADYHRENLSNQYERCKIFAWFSVWQYVNILLCSPWRRKN